MFKKIIGWILLACVFALLIGATIAAYGWGIGLAVWGVGIFLAFVIIVAINLIIR